MKKYKELSDQLWNEIQKGNVHGHNICLCVGGSKAYNKLDRLLIQGIDSPVVKQMKKSELEANIVEMEENIKKISGIIY